MAVATIRVGLDSQETKRSYDILIGEGLLHHPPIDYEPLSEASSLHIITDSNVAELYGETLRGAVSRFHRRVEIVSFPAGERHKRIETASKIASKLSAQSADQVQRAARTWRSVVGDLAGFTASIYKRGVDYVQFPTTLLAQVDSSIGGKTGVDTSWGKNQLGTFHQPKGVVIDPTTLKTLPPSEMANGVAEILKTAIIASRRMFDRLERTRNFQSSIPSENILERAG